jgi:hypothetical protein
MWRLIIDELAMGEVGLEAVMDRRGIVKRKQYGYVSPDSKAVQTALQKMNEKELRGLAVELCVAGVLNEYSSPHDQKRLEKGAEIYGVKLDKIAQLAKDAVLDEAKKSTPPAEEKRGGTKVTKKKGAKR